MVGKSFRPFALLLSVLAMSGCVHVNLPEHMVSDTVEAGKDLYRSIAHRGENAPRPARPDHRAPSAPD